jgi:PAS domain S-box-containing protein
MKPTPDLHRIALDQALERAGDGVAVVNADGRIAFWNRAAERTLGYSAREVLGRPCAEVFAAHDEHDNRLCYPGCQVRTLLGLGESVQSFDMRTRTRTGRPVWINVSVLPVRGEGAERPLIVYLFRDVTASKELLTLVHERLAGRPAAEAAEVLTRRELHVLRLMAAGLSTAAMADRLHVSRATVRNHIQHILTKLGVHSRLEAVAYANRHRLL